MRAILDGDRLGAERLLGATIVGGLDDELREFFEIRLADVSARPELQPLVRARDRARHRARRHAGRSARSGSTGRPTRAVGRRSATGRARQPGSRARDGGGPRLLDWAATEHGVHAFRASIAPDNAPSLGARGPASGSRSSAARSTRSTARSSSSRRRLAGRADRPNRGRPTRGGRGRRSACRGSGDPGQLDRQERVQEQAEDQQAAGAPGVDEGGADEPQRPADVAVRRRPPAAAWRTTCSTWTQARDARARTSATHGPIQPTSAAPSTIG